MKILHVVGRSLVQRTPARIATYWGRYFVWHSAKAIALRRPIPNDSVKFPLGVPNWCEPTATVGFLPGHTPRGMVRDLVDEADVVHCHDDWYPMDFERPHVKCRLKGKVLVYHAHIGNIPERFFRKNRRFEYSRRVKHVAITNGYGRLFDEDEQRSNGKRKWGRLPDVLELDHPTFRMESVLREPQQKGRLNVVYTYSNPREGEKINAKRPHGHRRLVQGVRGIRFKMVHGWPFEEAMALKKWGHVVLEEVFTPYLHLSALEGAIVGAAVLTNFDAYTRRELCHFVGSPEDEFPFYHVTPDTLPGTLKVMRDDPDLVAEWGRKAREWMLKYYDTERLLKRYLELYAS